MQSCYVNNLQRASKYRLQTTGDDLPQSGSRTLKGELALQQGSRAQVNCRVDAQGDRARCRNSFDACPTSFLSTSTRVLVEHTMTGPKSLPTRWIRRPGKKHDPNPSRCSGIAHSCALKFVVAGISFLGASMIDPENDCMSHDPRRVSRNHNGIMYSPLRG